MLAAAAKDAEAAKDADAAFPDDQPQSHCPTTTGASLPVVWLISLTTWLVTMPVTIACHHCMHPQPAKALSQLCVRVLRAAS